MGAGVLDLNLAKFALKNSIKDFEFFTGIPGTIGGAVRMNAGCYGAQTSSMSMISLSATSNNIFEAPTLGEPKLVRKSSL